MQAPVQTLDFEKALRRGEERRQFTWEVRESLIHTGFFLLKNHGIHPCTLTDALLSARWFFDLEKDVLSRYEFPELNHQMGYTSLHIETAKGADVPDDKHFFQVRDGVMPYVREVERFSPSISKLYGEFLKLYTELMRVVALSLMQPEYYFDGMIGNNVLRAIHYPKRSVAGMSAAPHGDINMLTLLFAEPGLELLHEEEWLPILTDSSCIVVNCGDMLEHLTGGRYRSGLHRVMCEAGKDRYAIPFFGHFKPECSIYPLRDLGTSDHVRYPYSTAGEFLDARLKEIGLKG
jgi:isopenicillin N synthase-like dioxygenase